MSKGKIKFYRYISAFMVLNILAEIISPTLALALTGGPSQPEFESFEPADSNQMVDLFSGDFTYNIPLMTVPGPNGGYPINLAYHAAPSMEQEATWVGLGWNINAGEVNRNMRGLPDDFNGDKVLKTLTYKPNKTWGVDLELFSQFANVEFFGLDASQKVAGLGFYYNSYKGIGITGKFGMNGTSIDYDSQGGYTLNQSVGYDFGKTIRASVSGTINSRQGILGFGLTLGSISESLEHYNKQLSTSYSIGISSYLPTNETPTTTEDNILAFKFGTEASGTFNSYPFSFNFSTDRVSKATQTFKAYGYNNLQFKTGSTETYELSDFNSSSTSPITEEVPALPVPALTHDIYVAKSQGLGGAFRPFRSDRSIVSDPCIISSSSGTKVNIEGGGGDIAHIGTAVDYVSTNTKYAGRWQQDNESLASFGNKEIDESTYYKFSGELTTDEGAIDQVNTDFTTKRFKLNPTQLEGTDKLPAINALDVPQILNMDDNGNPIFNNSQRSSRSKRVNNIEIRKFAHIAKTRTSTTNKNDFPGIGNHVMSTASPNSSSWSNYASSFQNYNYETNGLAHHQAEITVLNSDGYRYVYGLPTYNKTHKDVAFSSSGAISNTGFSGTNGNAAAQAYNVERLNQFSDSDAGIYNDEGRDNFYYATETPAYVHDYKLTAIYSADYVDLTNNGPSEDDLGYYVKFNYEKKYDNYAWRTPFIESHLGKGHYSDKFDDKALYSYGKKEIWYLNSIETKTHVALFKLNSTARSDAREPNAELNHSGASAVSSRGLYSLKQVDLYNKNDLSKSIKTAFFEYDYSLCPGVPNTTGVGAGNNGKLTLKKIWFSFLGNTKGKFNPYKFDYNASDPDQNPAYSYNNTDRWGSYKNTPKCLSSGLTCSAEDFPYVDQDEDYDKQNGYNSNDITKRNKHAAAWSLRKITLPSGGEMTVDYEQDDYAYVQDKQATQMFEIMFTGLFNGAGLSTSSEKISFLQNRIYFKLKTDPLTGAIDNNINHYIPAPNNNGKRTIFFKAYTELKNSLDFSYMARDYVNGYFDIKSFGTSIVGGTQYGYVEVVNVPVSKLLPLSLCHPITKAAWQYLKMERPDLLYPDKTIGSGYNALQTFLSLYKDKDMLLGFYNYCFRNGYATSLELGAEKPSFIRLLNPDGHKKGGGYRVKKITYTNNWLDMSTDINNINDTYGQEYSYLLADGSSSGVAEYEPIAGGEENPMRKPSDNYSSVNGPEILRNKDLYLEEPYCENYYPAANVGYSRVLVKNLTQPLDVNGNEVSKNTRAGIAVTEFYTAKDFPVKAEQTDVSHLKHKPFEIPIPFVGSVSYESHGYSQGYTIRLNNMHGKLFRQSTYPASDGKITTVGLNLVQGASPRAMTTYNYSTLNPFVQGGVNELNNSVTVLDNDGLYRTALVGQTGEDFVEMEERSEKAYLKDVEANIDIIFAGVPIPVPTVWPSFFRANKMQRTAVYNHVIYQNGIITSVKTEVDGSTSFATNLMYDADTGQPLLTSVTNNFDKPVYTYNYAAHWAYNGMNGAWKNQGWEYTFSTPVAVSGSITIPSANTRFIEGDQLEVHLTNGKIQQAWVNGITINASNSANIDISLKDENAGAYTSGAVTVGKFRVLKSGYKNLLSESMGHLVSLNNPINVSSGNSPLLQAINQHFTTKPASWQNIFFDGPGFVFTVFDCTSGTNKSYKVLFINTEIWIADMAVNGTWNNFYKYTFPSPPGNIHLFYFVPPNSIKAVKISDPNVSMIGSCTPPAGQPANLIPAPCNVDGVLQASAVHYTDNWNFNYQDIGDPSAKNGSKLSAIAANSPYRFGMKGIWRPLNTWAYQTERLQTSGQTHNYEDGTFKDFVPHNWLAGNERLYSPLKPGFSSSPSVVANANWTFVNENTQYNPYGFVHESVDALGIYSSALYGYANSVQTAVASNGAYYELAYDGFEDHGANYDITGHGHIKFNTTTVPLSATESHTGKYSYPIGTSGATFTMNSLVPDYYTNITANNYFTPRLSTATNKYKYLVSAWFKPDATNTNGIPQISITNAVSTDLVLGPIVDGWQKVDYTFETPQTSTAMNLNLKFNNGGAGYIDDIRVQPFKSAITTYVYNPVTLWNVAELDNRNFATFYNYDEEGMLVQVKKETEKGIVTIKAARSNIRRNPNP